MPYHNREIARGKYGELSKIKEELDEAIDAEESGNRLMLLIELSDILGAIDGYLAKHYHGELSLEDLMIMAKATKSAFASGDRK